MATVTVADSGRLSLLLDRISEHVERHAAMGRFYDRAGMPRKAESHWGRHMRWLDWYHRVHDGFTSGFGR